MKHEKPGLLHLAKLLEMGGIEHLVVSPGSRNAPLITIFEKTTSIQSHVIVDERSAAFFALGIAQQTGKTVAIVCTSGTAVLNYAPAIAEAYYQRVPLLILTADRPVEWIDQVDGQTIRQNSIFSNYIRKSVQLPQNCQNQSELWHLDRLVCEAMNAATFPVAGPVHINIPIAEPLYGFDLEMNETPKFFDILRPEGYLSEKQLHTLSTLWNSSKKKMILVGQIMQNSEMEMLLAQLASDPSVVVLTETLSNVHDATFVDCIDRCLGVIGKNAPDFEPDILLTFGGPVVSKRIKSFLRNAGIKHHWHIDPTEYQADTYQHLSLVVPLEPIIFLKALGSVSEPFQSDFAGNWQKVSVQAATLHAKFLSECAYNDLKIFEILFKEISLDFDIQLANSTPVRYAQLFADQLNHRMYSNRGTSGIDGSISTSAGAALATNRPTIVISGDLGFFYDSNALWNSKLPVNLKIIVINNGGGGIFRFLPGPDTTGLLESHFEARHQLRADGLAKTFGLPYFKADSEESLKQLLPSFLLPCESASILEIISPAEESAAALRAYFSSMNS